MGRTAAFGAGNRNGPCKFPISQQRQSSVYNSSEGVHRGTRVSQERLNVQKEAIQKLTDGRHVTRCDVAVLRLFVYE
jgi:hypothetical protein